LHAGQFDVGCIVMAVMPMLSHEEQL
jgi:hypothetical protein